MPKGLKAIYDCDGKKLIGDIRKMLEDHIKKAVQQGVGTNCLPSIAKKSFERNLKNPFKLRYGCHRAFDCGQISPGFPTFIDIFNDIWSEETKNGCGSPEAIIFHELLHFTVTGSLECVTYACTKQCYPDSTPPLRDEYPIKYAFGFEETDYCLKKDSKGNVIGRWQCCDEDIKEKNKLLSGQK